MSILHKRRKQFMNSVQPFEAELYRMAFIYMRNEQDALDAVQETMLKAYKSFHTLKEEAYLKTWLIRILIHTCLAELNRKSRAPRFYEQVMPATVPPEEKLFVHMLMDTLTVEEKNIILLHYYQDYTFQMISELLNMPLGTVKSVCYRALKKLKIHLEEGESDGEN